MIVSSERYTRYFKSYKFDILAIDLKLLLFRNLALSDYSRIENC